MSKANSGCLEVAPVNAMADAERRKERRFIMKSFKATCPICLIASLAFVLALAVHAQETKVEREPATPLSTVPISSQSFIQEAAQMNLAEIQMAELASQKSRNAEVKAYAGTLE